MRVTNKMLSKQVMNNLKLIYDNMNNYHTQISTGKSFQRASEEPYDAIMSMDINNRLKRIEQNSRNLNDAKSIITECETALNGIDDSIEQVDNLLMLGMNSTYNLDDRKNMAQVIDSMKDNIINILNKEFAGKYLFGGYNTSTPPIEVNESSIKYNGNDVVNMIESNTDPNVTTYKTLIDQKINYNTGKGIGIDVSMPGISIVGFGEDNLISILDKLSTAMKNPNITLEELEIFKEKLKDKTNNINLKISSLGGKIISIENFERQIEDDKFNLTELKSQIEGVDIEEAVINFKTANLVYNAALSVGAEIIQPTLVDFLR